MDATVWNNILLYVIIIWSIFWKGIALWRSALLKQKNWFVVILVLNSVTIGILEIVYLFWFAKKRLTFAEMKTWKTIFIDHVPKKK
jgi:hypothetical protein